MSEQEPGRDLVADLISPLPRATLIPALQAVLGVPRSKSELIVEAFDDFVAQPLEANLARLSGRDLAKRNPMIYTARGTKSVDEWIDQVLADKETSAMEAHLGTFLEEVARIVSGGVKPGSGVDLQVEDADGIVHLYAIQAAPNTKNAGGRRSDFEALKRAARPLRASRQTVELNIAVLLGRARTGSIRAEPDIAVLGSDEFWERVSGISDFSARLLKASIVLASLIKARASDEIARIRHEATALYGDLDGGLDLEALANPPRAPRSRAEGSPP